jgi:uncharacterized protein YecT (DUF1311 family)
MPNWRPPGDGEAEHAQGATLASEPDDEDIRLECRGPARHRPPRRIPRIPGAGFVLGAVVGAAAAWWVAGGAPETPAPRAAGAGLEVAAADGPVATDQPAVYAPPPAPEAAAPDPVAEPPPTDVIETAALAPETADVAHDTATSAPESAETETPTATKNCTAEPTPADRTICGDPELRRLRDELRRAYAEALDAHEERGLLRQRQLAWRDARNSVSEPARLSALYAQRIRRLNAATAQARSLRPE